MCRILMVCSLIFLSSMTFAAEELMRPPYFDEQGTHVQFLCFGTSECDVVSIPWAFLQDMPFKDSLLTKMVAHDLDGTMKVQTRFTTTRERFAFFCPI